MSLCCVFTTSWLPDSAAYACSAVDSEQALVAIRNFAAQKNYEAGIACADSWLAIHPDDRDFRLARIRLYAWKNDFAKANELMAAEAEDDPEVEAMRGELSFLQKDWPRAIHSYEKVARTTADPETQKHARLRISQARQAQKPIKPIAKPVPKPRVIVPTTGHAQPQLLHNLQLMHARESQDWTEQGLAAQVGWRVHPDLLLGVEGKTKTRSTPKIAYSDKAYGLNLYGQMNKTWGVSASYNHALDKLIYPGTATDITGVYTLNETWTLDLGWEHRSYLNNIKINLLHGGGALEGSLFRFSVHAYLGVGETSSGTTAMALRSLGAPWAAELYGALGREESSRPYLQAGEKIQGFYNIGLAALWASSTGMYRGRFGCERREERAFWHNACELGMGVNL